VGEAYEEEEKKRDRGEQRVEGERARQERDVVFVGCLEGAEEEAAR
jgi:hypothetical protein